MTQSETIIVSPADRFFVTNIINAPFPTGGGAFLYSISASCDVIQVSQK